MSDEILAKSLLAAVNISKRFKAPPTVVWHGGEPMALPVNWLYSACEQFEKALPKNASQCIQTSLIPYNEKWNDLIHRFFDSHIGSSVDFSLRTIAGSNEKYLNFWMGKVELARKDNIAITPGIVPSKHELGRGAEIVTWLYEREFKGFNIDRYNQYGCQLPAHPSNREHAQFLIEVFDSVIALFKNGGLIKNNVVNSVIGGVLYGMPGDRWGTQCQKDFVVINPDGSTNSCPDRIESEGSFSPITAGPEAFLSSEKRRSWARVQVVDHKESHCMSCKHSKWCRSGCPITDNSKKNGDDCSGYKGFIEHVDNYCRSKDGESLCREYYHA